jgi:hypothetical protein
MVVTATGMLHIQVMENITHKQIEVQKKFRTAHGFTQFISICYNEIYRGSFGWACSKDWGNRNCYGILEGRCPVRQRKAQGGDGRPCTSMLGQ